MIEFIRGAGMGWGGGGGRAEELVMVDKRDTANGVPWCASV